MKHFIGMRSIKTGIAVCLAIIAARFFNFEYPFFVAMTALISMDKTGTQSLKMARNRIFGTFLGACLGVLLATIDQGNPILCGLGITLLCALCAKLKLNGAIGISGIVLCAIMVHTDKAPLFYGWNRFAATVLGGGIGTIVNVCIAPYYNIPNLQKQLDKTWLLMQNLLDGIDSPEEKIELEQAHHEFNSLQANLKLYQGEIIFKKGHALIDEMTKEMDVVRQVLVEVDAMYTIDKHKHPEIHNYHVQKAKEIAKEYIVE